VGARKGARPPPPPSIFLYKYIKSNEQLRRGRGEGGFPTNNPKVFIKSKAKKYIYFCIKTTLPCPHPPLHVIVCRGENGEAAPNIWILGMGWFAPF